MENLLGAKVYLGLFVKVVPNWRENPMQVRELSWHTQLEGLGEGQKKKEEG